MPNTLLVVDGRSHPKALTERLGALGYACLYARGPLRARTVLSQETVDLILWKDNTGNDELSIELLAEWRRHPRIPVVRLYGMGGLSPNGIAPDDLAQSVYANLPVDLPELQLFTTLSRCLIEKTAKPGAVLRNELAFRNAVDTLRRAPAVDPDPDLPPLFTGDDAPTALSDRERELLRERRSAEEDSTVAGIKPWWKVWGRWKTVPRSSTAS